MAHPHKTIRLLALFCILSVIIMILALLSGGKEASFTPPLFDSGAVSGTPEAPEGLEYRMLDAGVFKAGICGLLIPRDGSIPIWFANPRDNTPWLRLRILDEEGHILGQTGLLRPGEYLPALNLDPIPPAGTSVILKIMAYEPETYHSAGAFTVRTSIAQP